MLSLHTSPLMQPGTGDSGGMNVYVRELCASMAQAGVETTVFTRRSDTDLPEVVSIEPGFQVVHVDAGDPSLPKEKLPETIPLFTEGVRRYLDKNPVDLLHANYWLSAVAGHTLKHDLGLRLLATFHTLARVKADSGDDEPQQRIEAETNVIGCCDRILVSCEAEQQQLISLYGADADRLEIVPPGVHHAFFSPGDRLGARQALGLSEGPVLLFVGRIQPLKGLSIAVEALAMLPQKNAQLLVVGGASGVDGPDELARIKAFAKYCGVEQRVHFIEPQPHYLLSTYYRAADVCIVPSRSESFGLVALEAAACGTPVVAADVGGLTSLVRHENTGYLLESRDPSQYANAISLILENPDLAKYFGEQAYKHSLQYTWSMTAARMRRVCGDVQARVAVTC